MKELATGGDEMPGGEEREMRSLAEVHSSVRCPSGAHWLRRLWVFSGPGFLVSVGYMDPGNWATCLAGGSKFGFALLFVVLISNGMAMVLQYLSARLGIGSDMDLAQACRRCYSRPVGFLLWCVCELAIIACDLAEVIGTALALKMLFGVPLLWGAVLTVLDAVLILLLMRRGFRRLEAFIFGLIVLVFGCFAVQLALSGFSPRMLLSGVLPSTEFLRNPEMLYIAIGILGATVMPHNLYLHSAVVQTRDFPRTPEGRREAMRWAGWDSTLALGAAFFVNAAILVLAAVVFHQRGHQEVAEIETAHALLSPLLGVKGASLLFGVALLASGLNSTVTGTLAGQVVMEGFLNIRLRPWARRLVTRGIAVLPVIGITAFFGEGHTERMLVLSQVVLSMQLPFAVVPLVGLVSKRSVMGELVIPRWLCGLAWGLAVVIIGLNVKLLCGFVWG